MKVIDIKHSKDQFLPGFALVIIVAGIVLMRAIPVAAETPVGGIEQAAATSEYADSEYENFHVQPLIDIDEPAVLSIWI